ncbi:hypothetical protein MGN70_004809 [Eutypa lata]|nr:hypothetical protein MGN70_004809 [Eutypa lata]
MYRRPPPVEYGHGHGHGYPRHGLVPPHPHRAVINHGGVPLFWRPPPQRAVHPPFPGGLTRRQHLEPETVPRCEDNGYHYRPDAVVVEVQLPRDSIYHCDRMDLLTHFPNIRHRLTGRILHVEDYIAGANRTALAEDALHHMFRAFELRRIAGLSVDLFERARDLLRSRGGGGSSRYGRDRDEFFGSAFDLFVGTCQALDSEGGLGCSDDLLAQIGEFALELKGAADFGPWNYHTLQALFAAYSQVFQPSTPRHMETLRLLWKAIDIDLKARLMTDLGRELAFHPQRSSAHIMFRALTDMGVL